MIGSHKMELTNASVAEALNDYMNKHLKTPVKVSKWTPTPNQYENHTLQIEFEEISEPKP